MSEIDVSSLPQDIQKFVQELLTENRRLKRKVSELTTEALHDSLTGLLNRRGFVRALDRSISFCQRYDLAACLIYIDLNEFKPINDTYGHAAGDVVLKTVAARLAANTRASDIVARLGGDEFVVLLWQISEGIAEWRANVLVEALCADKITVTPEVDVLISASAGVTVIGPSDKPDDLIDRADRAMYDIKTKSKLEKDSAL